MNINIVAIQRRADTNCRDLTAAVIDRQALLEALSDALAAREQAGQERDEWERKSRLMAMEALIQEGRNETLTAEVERLREALEKIVRKTEPGPYRSFAEKNRIQSLHDFATQALQGGDG